MASTSTGGAKPKSNVNRVGPNDAKKATENRDPNNLNGHLQIGYYDVLGEPRGVRSFDCVWEFSEILYGCCQTCCYKLVTLFCGVCIAIYWGLEFAPIIFTHVWCLSPFNQCVKITIGYWAKSLWYICIRCMVSPWALAVAPLFRHCGNGLNKRPETPSLFPKQEKRPKPIKQEARKESVAVPVSSAFDNYDKEQMARSVRRQLML